ncbi:MAG: DUF1592 domain-containing protein [Myxococcota bacterium]
MRRRWRLTMALAVAASAAACSRGDIGASLAPSGGTPSPTPRPTVSPTPTPTPTPTPSPTFAPGAPVMRRLLGREYLATISGALGPQAGAAATAPLDTSLNGLDAIGSSELSVSDTGVRTYEASARAAAAAAVDAGLNARYGACAATEKADAHCFEVVATALGRVLFRRSLEPEEIASYVAVGVAAAAPLDTYEEALKWLVTALLESPSFLYRTELGEADPARPGRRALSSLELASRLSFFLTGAGPDAALLDAAEHEDLRQDDVLRREARRLIALPSAVDALAAFYDEVLRLREIKTVPKNQATFPMFDEALRASMREETLRLIQDLAWIQNGDFRTIFDSSSTFVDARLASFYGLAAPTGAGFQKVSLDASSHRGGLFGQAGILSVLSHSVSTSPTLRGKFVREVLLCQAIPAPPPGVNTTLPEDPAGQPKTLRQKLATHATDNGCAGCHARMDPIGFGLEHFDAVGAYRDLDNGLPVDSATTMDGTAFDGPSALGSLLKNNTSATRCLVRTLFRQAVGRIEVGSEDPSLAIVDQRFASSGYRMKALLEELVLSEAFRTVSEVQ